MRAKSPDFANEKTEVQSRKVAFPGVSTGRWQSVGLNPHLPTPSVV